MGKKRVDYFVHNDKQSTCKWNGWDGIKKSSPKIFCTGCQMDNCGGKNDCRFYPRCPKCDCFVNLATGKLHTYHHCVTLWQNLSYKTMPRQNIGRNKFGQSWSNIGRTKQCPGTRWISVCNGNGRPTKNGKFFGWNLTKYSICSNKKHHSLHKCNKAFCKWICKRCNGTGKAKNRLRQLNRMVEEKLAAVEKKVNANGH